MLLQAHAFLPLVLAVAGSGSTPTTFTDETFDDADWQISDTSAGGVAVGSAEQVLEGNPMPARRVTHEFVSGSGLFSIWVRHLWTPAVYDPALEGPMSSVHYSLDSDGVLSSQRLNWALQQGGRFYVVGGPSTTATWTTHTSGELVAADFVERLSDGTTVVTSHPDFSATGAPITFGFETSNGSSAGAVRVVDYDNLRVDVNAVPSSSVVRLGSPPNANALLPGSTAGPVVGETWDPVVNHTSFLPSATMDVAFYSMSPIHVPTDYGVLLCGGMVHVQSVPTGTPFAFEVPDHALLIGAEFCVQAASVDAVAGSLLTNALDVVVGTY